MQDAAVQLKKTGEIVSQEDKEGYFLNYLQNAVRGVAIEVKRREVITPKKPGMTAVKSVAADTRATFPTEIMLLLKNALDSFTPSQSRKVVGSIFVNLCRSYSLR